MTADDGSVRAHYASYAAWLERHPTGLPKASRANALFHRYGITFAVYGEESGTERLIPFDIIRASSRPEWKGLRAGLRQLVKALNAFIHDIYNDQEILRPGGSRRAGSGQRSSSPGDDRRQRCPGESMRPSPVST